MDNDVGKNVRTNIKTKEPRINNTDNLQQYVNYIESEIYLNSPFYHAISVNRIIGKNLNLYLSKILNSLKNHLQYLQNLQNYE